MRARRLPILVALLALVGALAAVSVAAGAGKPVGLDTSYGKHGVVKLYAYEPSKGGPGETEFTPNGPIVSAEGFAAAPDGSAYVMADLNGCAKTCRNGPAVLRIDPAGTADEGFAGKGQLELPTGGDHYNVGTDSAGRILVAYIHGPTIHLSRFGADGAIDAGFGQSGSETLHCECGGGYRQVRLVRGTDGRMLLVVERALPSNEGGGAQFEIFRFLSGGGLDPSFGNAGKLKFVSPHGELARAVVVAPSGAILIGGSSCCGARQIFIERVTAGGRLDHHFDRTVKSSVRRLTALGEFPTLAGIVPRSDGGLVAIGTSQRRQGFYLRLGKDGRLVKGFGRRGLMKLPFLVDAAVPGVGGAIFAIGGPAPYGSHRALRILANGRPDPAYGGAKGLPVPLPGEPVRATPIAPGKILVTDKGDYECIRQCTPAEPALARFLE